MKRVSIIILAALSLCAGENEPQVMGAAGGRFVLGQLSSFRKDQFLLDTQTGRVWEIVVDKKDRRSFEPVKFNAGYGATKAGRLFDRYTVIPPKPDTTLDFWDIPSADSTGN